MGRYRDTGWLVWGDSRCLRESLGTLHAPHALTAEAQKSEPSPSLIPKPRIGDRGPPCGVVCSLLWSDGSVLGPLLSYNCPTHLQAGTSSLPGDFKGPQILPPQRASLGTIKSPSFLLSALPPPHRTNNRGYMVSRLGHPHHSSCSRKCLLQGLPSPYL